MVLRHLQELEQMAKTGSKKRLGLVIAEDSDALNAVMVAQKKGFVLPILIGDEARIRTIADQESLSLQDVPIHHCPDYIQAAQLAVDMVRKGEIQALMKGALSTSIFLRPIMHKDNKLVDTLINHLSVFEVSTYHKLLMVTDVAVNIKPTLQEKVSIIENTLRACHKLMYEKPKFAYICAVEKINPVKMPETEEAAILTQMANRHQLGDLIFDGPLALDNAISYHSLEVKKIESPVGGDADVIIVPEIISGNILYKSLIYLARAQVAGVIIGAKVPIVLTSRADDDLSKYYSILLALLLAE